MKKLKCYVAICHLPSSCAVLSGCSSSSRPSSAGNLRCTARSTGSLVAYNSTIPTSYATIDPFFTYWLQSTDFHQFCRFPGTEVFDFDLVGATLRSTSVNDTVSVNEAGCCGWYSLQCLVSLLDTSSDC